MSPRPAFKRRRQSLWHKQGGLCHWCHEPMVHWDDRDPLISNEPEEIRLRCATVDHLHDRHHPRRRAHNAGYEQRWVLACWLCNFKRGRASHMAVSIETRRAWSKRLSQQGVSL